MSRDRLAWEEAKGFPKTCAHCGAAIWSSDDDWVRLDVMHHDRVGLGTLEFCDPGHAALYLAGYARERRRHAAQEEA